MATRLTLRVPEDYLLTRDACSYGYFLLAPNHWDVRERTFSRVLDLEDGPAVVRIRQGSSPGQAPALNDGRAPGRAGTALSVLASRGLSRAEREQTRRLLTRMLRLDESEEVIADFHRVDPRFANATGSGALGGSAAGRGRLMRSPTFFEDVIKTVTSCNVAWPSTIAMNTRLCEVVGRGRAGVRQPPGAKAFPTPRRIVAKGPGVLRARCRVGYRDRRIVELADLFLRSPRRGGIDPAWFEDPATPDDAVHAALLELPGIGPYAAANVMQLLGRYARLPLDSESLRHARGVLGWSGTDRALMARLREHYAPMGPHAFRSYWFELWWFYEWRRGPAWTWERETTGKTFTASALKD